MTYTRSLRKLRKRRDLLRQATPALDDALLELRDREKRLAELDREVTDDIAAQYGMETN